MAERYRGTSGDGMEHAGMSDIVTLVGELTAVRGQRDALMVEVERLRGLVGDAANEQVEYLDKNSALEAAVKRLQDRIAAMERGYKTLRDGAEEEVVELRKLLRESADAERDHYATQVSVLMKSGWYRRVREALGDE
jgi:predicted nuclease with TOPRIM domain